MHAAAVLLKYVRPQRWVLPLLVVLGLLSSLSEGIGIGMIIPLLDSLMQGGEEVAPGTYSRLVGLIRQYGGELGERERLILLIGTILCLIVLKAGTRYGFDALSIWFNGKLVHNLRCALFARLLKVGYAFFAHHGSGRLLNTLDLETWRTSQALASGTSILISGCNLMVLGTLLLCISWQLSLIAGAGALLIGFLVRIVAQRSRRLGDMAVVANSGLSQRMLEALSAMRTIRLFGRETYEQRRFEQASDRTRRRWLDMELVSAQAFPLSEIAHVLLFLGTLLLAWYAEIGLAALFTFMLLLYRLQPHLRALDHDRIQLAGLMPAVIEVAELLDPADKPVIRSGSRPFHGLDEAVTFERVSFRYSGTCEQRPAVVDITLQIRRNRITAIVGGSGAGKSTLVSLLCRLYDPDQGRILVDGVPLPELELAAWRGRIAFAGQDVDLMGETIYENIVYGRPWADRADVIAAAQQADAHDFIMSLPETYDTQVGERGLRLSSGQRQRVGLARALVRNPEILILDEATNALDSLSEEAIQNALERFSGQLTMVVIAHRLSTIRHAHHVVVLKEGRLIEQGPPDQLLRGNGVFSRLWEMQAFAFDEAKRVTHDGGSGQRPIC